MTTSSNVPSITKLRGAGPLLSKSNALTSGRSLQGGDAQTPPPVDKHEFQGQWAMQPLAWTQLYDAGIFYRCAIRTRWDKRYLVGGRK
eukprot:346429-Alexandrium_andersonii.AAC.1